MPAKSRSSGHRGVRRPTPRQCGGQDECGAGDAEDPRERADGMHPVAHCREAVAFTRWHGLLAAVTGNCTSHGPDARERQEPAADGSVVTGRESATQAESKCRESEGEGRFPNHDEQGSRSPGGVEVADVVAPGTRAQDGRESPGADLDDRAEHDDSAEQRHEASRRRRTSSPAPRPTTETTIVIGTTQTTTP